MNKDGLSPSRNKEVRKVIDAHESLVMLRMHVFAASSPLSSRQLVSFDLFFVCNSPAAGHSVVTSAVNSYAVD